MTDSRRRVTAVGVRGGAAHGRSVAANALGSSSRSRQERAVAQTTSAANSARALAPSGPMIAIPKGGGPQGPSTSLLPLPTNDAPFGGPASAPSSPSLSSPDAALTDVHVQPPRRARRGCRTCRRIPSELRGSSPQPSDPLRSMPSSNCPSVGERAVYVEQQVLQPQARRAQGSTAVSVIKLGAGVFRQAPAPSPVASPRGCRRGESGEERRARAVGWAQPELPDPVAGSAAPAGCSQQAPPRRRLRTPRPRGHVVLPFKNTARASSWNRLLGPSAARCHRRALPTDPQPRCPGACPAVS